MEASPPPPTDFYNPAIVAPDARHHPDLDDMPFIFEDDEALTRLLVENDIRLNRGAVRQLTRAATGDPERARDYFFGGASATMPNGRQIRGGADIPESVVDRAAKRQSYSDLDTALADTYKLLQDQALIRGIITKPGTYGGLTFSHDVGGYNVTFDDHRTYIGLWTAALSARRGDTVGLRTILVNTIAHEIAHNEHYDHNNAHLDKTIELMNLARELELADDLRVPVYQWNRRGGWNDAIRDSGAAYGITRKGVSPEARGMVGRAITERTRVQADVRASYDQSHPYLRRLAERWQLNPNAGDLSEQIEEVGDLIALGLLDTNANGDMEAARTARDAMSMTARVATRRDFATQLATDMHRQGESDTTILDALMDYGFRPEEANEFISPLGPQAGPSAMASEGPSAIPGVTHSRAAMTREGGAEEKLIAQNKQTIIDAYAGDMPTIVVREGVQNLVDASRGSPGAHGKVAIFTDERRIWLIDQGTGMPKSVVENEFTEYKSSFKPDPNSSGGKGTAKVAILGRNDRVEVRTVARVNRQQTAPGTLPPMAERANAIMFNHDTGELELSDDNGFSGFFKQDGLASVELYDFLGESLTESLMAVQTPTWNPNYYVLYGEDLERAKEAALAAATTPVEDDGPAEYEETIVWGNSDDYLRPSKGLNIMSGPYGWVDQAVAAGLLGEQFTDGMLAAPWETTNPQLARVRADIAELDAEWDREGSLSTDKLTTYNALALELNQLESEPATPQTGTRISVVMEADVDWKRPTHNPDHPSDLEGWMDDFIGSNRIPGQTVEFVLDGDPYVGQPLDDKQRADTLLDTVTDPNGNWAIDFYATEAVKSDNWIDVDVQNNGLFQLKETVILRRAITVPTRLTANIRALKGAKEKGYPWNGSRDKLINGSREAIVDFINKEMMGKVLAREKAGVEAALNDAIDLPDGDGKLFNIGRVTGPELADLQDLARRPYMATLNRGMTDLHNALSAALDGQSWGYGRGGKFQKSSFGGFGLSADWQGLNIGLAGHSSPWSTPFLLLYDPWNLLTTAASHALDSGEQISEGETARVAQQATPRYRAMDITDDLLNWDPNAELTVVWTDANGVMQRLTMPPSKMLGMVRHAQSQLEKESREPGSVRPFELEYNRPFVAEVGPQADAYLEMLAQHLAARVLVDGTDQEMVDPHYPRTEPRDGSDPDYYTHIDGNSVDELYAALVKARAKQRAAVTEEQITNAGHLVEHARRLYEFNRDVEERIWEHTLASGSPVTDANPDGVPTATLKHLKIRLDQAGVDRVGRDAIDFRGYADQSRDDDPDNSWGQYYEVDAERADELLRRIERVTGMTPTKPGDPLKAKRFGAEGALRDAVEPGQRWTDDFILAYAMGLLGTSQHEFTHNAVRPHEEVEFSSFLSAVNELTNRPHIREIVERMVQELADSGGLRALAADMDTHGRIISADNVFEKVGVEEAFFDPNDWPADPSAPPADRRGTGGMAPLPGAVPGGGEPGGVALPDGVPEDGRGGRLQPTQPVLEDGGIEADLADPVRRLQGEVRGLDGVRPFGGSASAYHDAVIRQSPTLQAAAAESAATLRDNLADALAEDDLFGLARDERDQQVIDGFAQFYTNAVIGLAANDAERLDSVGLTPEQAEVERERALTLLGTNERMTALYEAEAAWASLAGPDDDVRMEPSAMASQGPPKLAEPFFSPLIRHTGNLPEIMTGVDEVRTPDRTVPERVVRRANTIRPGETPRPNRDGTVTTVVAPNGDWVQPERTVPGEVTPAMTPGQQALAILVEAGAKPDELTWTGLRQWLTQHKGEQLTRAEVSDYLQDNQVQIKEVLFEGKNTRWAGPEHDLVTPGGENQRELLLTLPQSATADAADRAVAALEAEVTALGLPTNTTADRIMEAGGPEDLANRWTRFKLYGDIGLRSDAYEHGHWAGERNVIVHIRFNERIDADGKRVLFIEEIQSDWHQSGRKHGYRTETALTPEQQARFKQLADAQNRAPLTDAERNEYFDLHAAMNGGVERIGAVPDAPWKATPAWTGLAMRRMVRWAAENGFERIAWTTGDQQNVRGSLVKRISAIAYSGSNFRAWNHDAEEVVSETGVREEDLPQYVGEEVAARLLAQKPEGTMRRLSGLDLETGAKPMRDFYDQILVGVAEDIGKTWGVKVGTTTLPPVAPDRSKEPYIEDLWDGYVVHDAQGERVTDFDRRSQAEDYLDEHWDDLMAPTAEPAEVHAMDLPPLMLRSALEEGQPMFMASGRPEPEGMMPLWDEMDSADVLDQEIIDAIEAYSAGMEIDDPNALPRTDGPEQIGLILPIPEPPVRPEDMPTPDPMLGPALPGAAVPDMSLLGPVYPDDMNLDQFPEWAQGMLQLGDWADPGQLPGTTSEIDDVKDLVLNGAQAGLLNAQEQKVLAAAILLQWARLKRAIDRATTVDDLSPWAAAQVVEESRRYTALRGLAAVARSEWPSLAEVWKSSPISQGEGQTLEDFFAARQAARGDGSTDVDRETREAGLRRTAALAGQGRPRYGIGPNRPNRREDSRKAQALGSAVAKLIKSPTMRPSNAGSILSDADLSVGKTEFLLAMRYNNILLGPRGILVDYATNTGMLFGKMMADPFLLAASEGVVNPRAWGAINAAEYAALSRAWPLAKARAWRVITEGVSDLESEVTGTPRHMSGRFGRRIEMAQMEGAGDYSKRVLMLKTGRIAAVTFGEAAGRLKSVADVMIKELAFGMEMTRQAAVMAYREGDHKTGSEEWHKRVAEILAGKINPNAKTREEKVAAQRIHEQMLANSYREAERTTFQGPMGQLGRMMEPIHRHPVGQFVLPFLRALYHISHWAIDLSPIGAMATMGDVMRSGIYRGLMRDTRPEDQRTTMTAGQKFLAKTGNLGGFDLGWVRSGGLLGGPYQQAWKGAEVGPGVADLDRRILANVVGTSAFFYVLSLAFAGAISGVGPPDEAVPLIDPERPDFTQTQLRATMEAKGWRRYSVRINWFNGKTYWVNYQNWGPLAYMLGSAAAIAETYKYGLSNEKKTATTMQGKLYELATQGDADMFRSGTRRFFGTMKDMSYWQGLVDLAEAVEIGLKFGPPPPGESPSDRDKRQKQGAAGLGAWAAWQFIGSFLPNSQLVNTIGQTQDAWTRGSEFGSIPQSLAGRIPDTIGPPGLTTNAIPSLLDDTLGSTTGRRAGLPVKVDALGRPIPNEYQGIWAWLPFRAVQEEIGNKSLDTLIAAGVGAPTPPSEMYYRPIGDKTSPVMVQLPTHLRQQIAAEVGKEADARVQKLVAETPVAQQQGTAWSDKLKEAMKDVYFSKTREISERPETKLQLGRIVQSDSRRVRDYESKNQKDAIRGAGTNEEKEQGVTPSGTPIPGPTPRPGSSPTATPRQGATPAATPRPGVTPTPSAPRLTEEQLEEQRKKARDRAGVGR